MSNLQSILQWVAISGKPEEEKTIIYQFDDDNNQLNISYMLDLSDHDELDALIAIPVGQRLGNEVPIGNPFVAIDLRSGIINVNGTNWNFLPHGIDSSTVKFRPIWYHSIDKQYDANMGHLGDRITQYKIGWQFTHEKKNYQRILFYDVKTGIFSLKEKR